MNKSLIHLCSTALICFGLFSCASAPLKNTASGTQLVDLIIQNVTTVDALSGKRSNMDVMISGRDIVDVIKHQADVSASAKTVVDASGKFLIPGLWDAHVHTTFTPEISDAMIGLFIGTGITSIRDTGGQLDLVSAWKKKTDLLDGPTMYMAGPLIDGVPTVYDGVAKGFAPIAISTQTPQQVIKAVDDLAAAGVSLVKAYEMLSPESFKTLITQAHKHGLPVTGHVPLSMRAVDVAAAGLDSMEHLRNLEMDCSERETELFDERQVLLAQGQDKPGSKLRSEIHAAQHFEAVRTYDDQRCQILLEQLAKYDVWQIPTLTLMLASIEPFYADEDWWKTFDYLPADTRTSWLKSTSRLKKSLSIESPARAKRAQVADWKKAMIGKFIEYDIPIMAGTDAPLFYLTPGFSLHKELQTLVSAGMTPLQALESATLAPAKYFKLDDDQGTIAAGKLADLVLLDADPLADISNTLKINSVIRQGVLLDRAKLDDLLDPNN